MFAIQASTCSIFNYNNLNLTAPFTSTTHILSHLFTMWEALIRVIEGVEGLLVRFLYYVSHNYI